MTTATTIDVTAITAASVIANTLKGLRLTKLSTCLRRHYGISCLPSLGKSIISAALGHLISFTSLHTYSHPQHLVIALRYATGQECQFSPYRTGAMQEAGCELRRIFLPRTPVNKPLRGAPGFVVWHASRC